MSKSSSGKKKPNKPSLDSLTRTKTIGPSQQVEATFSDDAMLEDGVDAERSERTTRRSARQESLNLSEMDEVYEEVDEEDEDED